MADLYRNQLVNSYPTYSQSLAQVNSWDTEHQKLFTEQMQVLLDGMNSTAKIPPADASDINHNFADMYNDALAKNRDLNLQRYDALAAEAANIEQLQDAYEHSLMLAEAAQKSIADSMQTRYGQALDEMRQKAAGIKQYMWVTVGDDRVRSSHQDKHGQVYDWRDSPHPGDEYGCRCSAVPASFYGKDASGIAEPVYPELLLPIFRALGLVRSLFRSNPKPKPIQTNHGTVRAYQRNIKDSEISEAISSAEKSGNIVNKVGKYGTPQKHYIGSNGITVVKEIEGRNAGKIITLWRRQVK